MKLWIADQLDKDLEKYRNLPQHLKRVQVNVATEGYLPSAMLWTQKEHGRDIMAEVLAVFRRHWDEGNRWMVHMLTKSHMVLKHLDFFKNMRDQVQLELTITTLDERRKKLLEGVAPSVKERFEIVRRFSDEGIFVRIMCMPLLGTREDAEEIRWVGFEYGAKGFKQKGVNYWDEKQLLKGKNVKNKGRKDEVFEDLLVKSSEPVFEDGKVVVKEVPMPRIENGRWIDWELRPMPLENSGYSEMNDIDWGYVF